LQLICCQFCVAALFVLETVEGLFFSMVLSVQLQFGFGESFILYKLSLAMKPKEKSMNKRVM
jgi:hypothetical protein